MVRPISNTSSSTVVQPLSSMDMGATAGVLYGQKVVPGGYQMTIAIPWTTLGTTPKAGTQYGFDVMVDERDQQRRPHRQVRRGGATEDLSYAYPYLFVSRSPDQIATIKQANQAQLA